jgi:hypothetical protein
MPKLRHAILLSLLLSHARGAALAQSGDAFVCYAARASAGSPRFAAVTVAVRDEWNDGSLDLRRPKMLCAPADVGGGIVDATTFLRAYTSRVTRHTTAPAAQNGIHTSNLLGDLTIDRKSAPQLLLAPSAVDPGADPPPPAPGSHDLDHYRCHGAHSVTAFPGGEITVQDALSPPRTLRLTKLLRQCSPVDAQGADIVDPARELLCYRVRVPRGESKHVPVLGLHTADSFATARVDTRKERELCLPTRAIGACNRHGELCDRAFDAVAYPTTHNAMSNAEEGWLGPNQNLSITHQLEAGVRALMLDTWYLAGAPVLCHGGDVFPCDLTGFKPLAEGLTEIRTFLDRHPNEVVSIIFESYISELDTQVAFFDSGLIQYAHAQPAAASWPPLRDLIENNSRLVVFTDDGSASLPWHHYVWDHAWETHYSFAAPQDFSCAKNRGSLANPLFILNHFLTNLIGSPALADMVNHNPLFLDRAMQCRTESGQLPNFVTVDFFDIGDLFTVVDTLNGV